MDITPFVFKQIEMKIPALFQLASLGYSMSSAVVF